MKIEIYLVVDLQKYLTNFHYNMTIYTNLIYVTFDSGTARPIQRKLTSQLQSETESAEDRAKITEHLELSADLTKLLLPVLLEVSLDCCVRGNA